MEHMAPPASRRDRAAARDDSSSVGARPRVPAAERGSEGSGAVASTVPAAPGERAAHREALDSVTGYRGGPHARVERDGEDPPIIAAAIQAIETNESGGRAVARESAMDTSAPNPGEPGRGQHASYASASQMIPSHAIGSLRGSPEGRALAAEHGLSSEDLDTASAAVQASNRIWDAVVDDGWTYERLVADTSRRGHARDLERTGFTAADVARMIQFRNFKRALVAQRARVLAVRDEIEAALGAQADRVEAQIASMRAEALPHGHPDATREGAGGAGVTWEGSGGATGEGAGVTWEGAGGAGGGGHAGVGPDTAASEGGAEATAGPDTTSREVDAAMAQVAASVRDQVAGIRGFARPAGWAAMAGARRRGWLATATTRLRGARRHVHHVASSAADALVAHELASDPAVAAMHFDPASVRAYIHSESHFLARWHEDRGGWARRALQNQAMAPAADGSARSLDAAIAGAAADEGGHRLTRIDLSSNLRAYLSSHPDATPEQVVSRAADVNSGNNAEYRRHILEIFHHQHPSWATEHPPASAPAAS